MGGGLPKNYSDEGGGHAKKIGNGGGHTIFKLHSSKSHQPPLPHKKWTVPKVPNLHKRVTQKFLEVSRCRRAKQRQRNVQKKSVLHVLSCFFAT